MVVVQAGMAAGCEERPAGTASAMVVTVGRLRSLLNDGRLPDSAEVVVALTDGDGEVKHRRVRSASTIVANAFSKLRLEVLDRQ